MKNIILFDGKMRDQLLPLTYTRPTCELRCGILTIREKWIKMLDADFSYITQEYLQEKYPIKITNDNILINGALIPTENLKNKILTLKLNEAITMGDELLAIRLDHNAIESLNKDESMEDLSSTELNPSPEITLIQHCYDIFVFNGPQIISDFDLMTKGKKSCNIDDSNLVFGANPIFVEEGAKVYASTLNTTEGPIYIGKDAQVMEHSAIRGPFALGDNSILKMGAKIYKDSTIGPHCKVGGEISNVVFQGYSNKSHDGYLGNSVIGQWCNIGADSNSSNLKNNYEFVKLWNYHTGKFDNTDLQFCGLIMGDHSKCGINTMFNTGTVIGVSCNIFGDGFPRNFIPSFSWGGANGYKTYDFKKSIATAQKVLARRNIEMTDIDSQILQHIFDFSSVYRPDKIN